MMKKIKDFEATVEDVWEREKEYEQSTLQYFRSEIYNALDIVRRGVEKPKRIITILPLVSHLLEMRKMEIGESRKKRL